jgi:D-glycero-alpha-D-manno-heptose-7-phosphate kinase
MGKQDHFAAAYGNLNVFSFNPDETVTVEPVLYKPEIKKSIESNLLLFYLKSKRDASNILKIQQQETQNKLNYLRELKELVFPFRNIFSNWSGNDFNKFGELLDKGWMIKREITDKISSDEIDNYYHKAKESGAIGGKLLGAGGGGFLLLYVENKHKQSVIDALSDLFCLPIGFDDGGTRITYYDQPVEFSK